MSEAPTFRIKVWDVPTRLTHWLLVAAFLYAWFSAGAPQAWWDALAPYGYLAPLGEKLHWWGSDLTRLQWHRWSGYFILGLMVFRLYWGFLGAESARFSHFLTGPGQVVRYAGRLFSRDGGKSLGHNPLGGWSVIALIAVTLAIVGLGLFAVDVDAIEGGPLSDKVSFDFGRDLAYWHHTLFNLALGLIVLHLAAIAFYLFVKRENLAAAMVTGRKPRSEGQADLKFAPKWRLLLGLAVAIGVAWFIAHGLRV